MAGGLLTEIEEQDCLRLLRDSHVGRVVYTEGALLVCTPVNFTLYGDQLVFRTSATSRLAAVAAGQIVAFEVDEVDELSHSGWSILVTGLADVVRDPSTLARLSDLDVDSWAGEDRDLWVQIRLTRMVGRRLGYPSLSWLV